MPIRIGVADLIGFATEESLVSAWVRTGWYGADANICGRAVLTGLAASRTALNIALVGVAFVVSATA